MANEDLQYYADAASFISAKGTLEEQTAPVAGWFWWSFNANSMGELPSKTWRV